MRIHFRAIIMFLVFQSDLSYQYYLIQAIINKGCQCLVKIETKNSFYFVGIKFKTPCAPHSMHYCEIYYLFLRKTRTYNPHAPHNRSTWENTKSCNHTYTYKHRYSNNQKWKTGKNVREWPFSWKYCVHVYVVVSSSYHVPLDVHIYLYLFYNVLQSRVYYLLSAFYRQKTTNDYY